MAYTAAADSSLSSLTPVPAIAPLQRALLWSVGAAGAVVFVEPSPYEFATLAAIIIFLATGLKLRLVFLPLLVLLFLVNVGPFNQPLGRAIFYGVFEGGVVTALLLVATANEKSKRRSGGPP